MSEFFKNIGSVYWWLSVVIVGILINLVSAYLKSRLDTRLSHASTWWRKRSEAQKIKRIKELAKLRGSSHEQNLLALDEIRSRIQATQFLVMGGLLFVIALSIPDEVVPELRIPIIIASSSISLLGAITFILGIVMHRNAEYKYSLLEESRRGEKSEDESYIST